MYGNYMNNGILNDRQIIALCEGVNKPMIDPFVNHQVRYKELSEAEDPYGTLQQKVISYGVTSFGYDITLASVFKAYNRAFAVHQSPDKWNLVVDPLDFNKADLLDTFIVPADVGYTIIPPHGYYLGHSNETLHMPEDVSALLLTKSTYARIGLFCNTTPMEPGWEGQITLELANLTDRPIKLYIDQGIGQLQFFKGDRPNITYADRNGKYQGQTGITTPIG